VGPLIRALALLCLLPACAVRTGVRDKGLEPARTTLEALAEVAPPRRYAVVMGVNRYEDPTFPALKHAVDDAEALSGQLRSEVAGGFDEVVTLTDPTRGDALAALREVAAKVRRDDLVLVYFSGHGTRVRVGEQSRRFLLVRDATARDLSTSALELESLQAWVGALPASRRALIVDACFDGDGKSVARPGSVQDLPAPRHHPGLGEAHLFATTAGRPSREDDKLGHGVYTYYLLDALSWSFQEADLDGDGVLTAWEAHDHARSRVVERTEGVQVPEAAFQVVGEADVVLAGQPDARQARERALVYLYPSGGHDFDGATLAIDGRDKGTLPGTVPLAPGRHHVRVRDADGEVVVDGVMRFASGRSYRADEVARLAQGPSRMLGWRLVTVSAPPLAASVGSGVVGPELWWARRRNEGSAVGLLTELSLGVGAAPSRRVDGQLQFRTRPVVWGSIATGYQRDVGRVRLRGALGLSPVWVPPSYLDGERDGQRDPYEVRSEAGWLFAALGPQLGVGWVLGRGWTLHAEIRPHVGVLDPDGDGIVQAVPWWVNGVGLEADF